MPDGYRERVSRVPGAVVWSRPETAGPPARVLPDGCMDLLWADGELLVAGPDTRAYVVASTATFAGLRFAPGDAPTILGVPAHELRDQRVPLDALWPAARVRRLAGRVSATPDRCAGLEDVALDLMRPTDPTVRAVAAALAGGRSVAATAAGVGLGERQLLRRCLDAFGYGPKTLARILRLGRALDLARAGVPFAAVAARSGYADQAHLSRDVRALAGVPLRTLLPAAGGAAQSSGANRSTPLPSGS